MTTPEPGGTPGPVTRPGKCPICGMLAHKWQHSGTPGTEAGRRLIRNLTRQVKPVVMGLVLDDILAIEAEAARSEGERLRVMFDEEGCQAVYGDLNDPDRRP